MLLKNKINNDSNHKIKVPTIKKQMQITDKKVFICNKKIVVVIN